MDPAPLPATRSTPAQRIVWMDAVRGAAIAALLLLHATMIPALYQGTEPPEILIRINNFLGAYRMPLLMALSGMLLPRSLGKPLTVFYPAKVRALLWPYLVWAVVLLAVTGKLDQLFAPQEWIPVTYIWFLLFVFLYYCAAPVLTGLPVGVVLVASLVAAALTQDHGFITKFFLFCFYFYLGYGLARSHRALDLLQKPSVRWGMLVTTGHSQPDRIVRVASGVGADQRHRHPCRRRVGLTLVPIHGSRSTGGSRRA